MTNFSKNWTPELQKESQRESQRKYYQLNKQKCLDSTRNWQKNHRERYLESKRLTGKKHSPKYIMNRKFKVLSHYSNGTPKCARCGFSDIRALQIDHINGNGNKQRRSTGILHGGITFYCWLIKNNFPPIFQVLCANCNWIKRFEEKELIK